MGVTELWESPSASLGQLWCFHQDYKDSKFVCAIYYFFFSHKVKYSLPQPWIWPELTWLVQHNWCFLPVYIYNFIYFWYIFLQPKYAICLLLLKMTFWIWSINVILPQHFFQAWTWFTTQFSIPEELQLIRLHLKWPLKVAVWLWLWILTLRATLEIGFRWYILALLLPKVPVWSSISQRKDNPATMLYWRVISLSQVIHAFSFSFKHSFKLLDKASISNS